jgi:hypothetical protein
MFRQSPSAREFTNFSNFGRYGRGRWRKLKGIGRVRLPDGSECDAELHWYEAHGIGKKEMKVKELLD